MSDWDLETRVLGVTAPSVPTWAVFAPEEKESDGEEIWTEQVHLWAHPRTALPPDRAAEEEFLQREYRDRRKE